MKTILAACVVLSGFALAPDTSEAQQCFVQNQPVVVGSQFVQQPVFVRSNFVRQPVFVRSRFVRQPVFVRSRFVRQPVFIRNRAFIGRRSFIGSPVFIRRGFVGGGTLRNLSLLGVFGRRSQRFSAFATGLGF